MPKTKNDSIVVQQMETAQIDVVLVGTAGLYSHRMAAKAKRALLLGSPKKTAAEKRIAVKHDPRAEFVDSMYFEEGWHPDTHVRFPAMAVKSAMGTAALVVPGVQKTAINRLVYIPTEHIPLYGIPKLRMDVVRSADIARTPDIRTRAYFPEWATVVSIQFSRPALSETTILNLLHNAGLIAGIGDNRQEKGKGSFGTFRIGTPDDLIGLKDASAQLDAIRNPVPENLETAELLAEFDRVIASKI